MDSSVGCPYFFNSCGESMQEKLNSPMPWIGMYVAAASAIITIAMAADIFHGFKYRKWWLPSKYLSMNAFTLTVLAISMKLPVDLTNHMLRGNEILARVSSLALMSIVMGNLMTSLGIMEFNEIILNLATVGTLVITIIVNVSIHISQMLDNVGEDFRDTVTLQIYAEQITCAVFMFILFFTLCSWGLIVPGLRRLVEKEYHRLNEKTSTKQVKWGDFTIDELRAVLREYWVNVKIGNPQFSIACSEISAASGAFCLLTALTLLEALVRMHFVYNEEVPIAASCYKWSINWILIIQTVGVGLGTIPPVFRWFLAAKLKSWKIRQYCFKELLGPSPYDGDILFKWTTGHPSSPKLLPRGFLQSAKSLVILFQLIVMIVIVLFSGLLLLVSAVFVKIILLPFPHDKSIEEIESAWFALCKGEGLTADSVKSICSEVDKLIEIAEKKQLENLIKLLRKSGHDFNGVREFVDRPISGPDDALNCWSLSIVILTGIAIQLHDVPRSEIDELKRGINEGLHFVKLIEKSLNENLERYRYSHEADDLWSELLLFGTCTRIDIRRDTSAGTREALRVIAGSVSRRESGCMYYLNMAIREALGMLTVPSDESRPESDFMYSRKMTTRSIRSMSAAIVGYITKNPGIIDTDLFERISVMISGILSACLTNLVPLITFMCTNSAIKEREENVREAAILFGQTREILEMLQRRRLPGLDPEKAAHLHEWRSFMVERNQNWMASDSE